MEIFTKVQVLFSGNNTNPLKFFCLQSRWDLFISLFYWFEILQLLEGSWFFSKKLIKYTEFNIAYDIHLKPSVFLQKIKERIHKIIKITYFYAWRPFFISNYYIKNKPFLSIQILKTMVQMIHSSRSTWYNGELMTWIILGVLIHSCCGIFHDGVWRNNNINSLLTKVQLTQKGYIQVSCDVLINENSRIDSMIKN